jgi:hypothetical protein
MFVGQPSLCSDQDKGWTTEKMKGCVSTRQRQQTSLLFTTSKSTLRPAHPPVQRVLMDFSWG